MENTQIKPAVLFLAGGIDANGKRLPMSGPLLPEDRHTIAALCLFGQPLGFTREDVEMLRAVNSASGARSLADRIEALLPPENGQGDM